jgi:hypothetical protein
MARIAFGSSKGLIMIINRPDGLPEFGYSQQASAIASALVQHCNALQFRNLLNDWLSVLDDRRPDDFDRAQHFADFLTDLCRIGAGIRSDFDSRR